MAIAPSELLIARNPATGAELGRVDAAPLEDLAAIVETARAAQSRWSQLAWRDRREVLKRWWTVLARDADGWADSLRDEIGKPRPEAMSEVVATLDALRWTVKNAGRALAGSRLGPGWQRWLLLPAGRLEWRPFGVVGMIGTWNYPLYLNAPPIAHAIAAGNAVVWKPSELAPGVGLRLQQSLEEAGMPASLVTAVFGGTDVGRALVGSAIDKGMFTGGIENGLRVLGELGRRGIPALAELSGFDPAIVLPDAPVEKTVPAIAWAAFVAGGQACIAIKRVYVVGDPDPWAGALAAQARSLRVGDPAACDVDMGPLISEAARDRFQQKIDAAVRAGARVLTGGNPLPGPGWFYAPTVLLADGPEPETALAGCFGPLIVVRGMADPDAAVAAANASAYGLAASVWSRDVRAARVLAGRLEAGMIGINEAVLPSAHAAAPFGGVKASGYGRVHGVLGLREFVQPVTIHSRAPGGLRPHLFPYSARLGGLLGLYRRLFHPR
ncbi:MAG TPA: aldehyde dehydrogenase family protein [Isosphaeraceae bacterium]|jgi:acyl-CoA reductase-like NAD-dependent aldehyde dehydrogenase|nr:aldehyde dehydrogenase family protein [Isosphaeraceae bacterium]